MSDFTVIFEKDNQIIVEWTVQRHFPSKKFARSPEFEFLNAEWRLQIYTKQRNSQSISMCLARRPYSQEQRVSFSLRLKSGDEMLETIHLEHTYKNGNLRCGSEAFIKRCGISRRFQALESEDAALKVFCMARYSRDKDTLPIIVRPSVNPTFSISRQPPVIKALPDTTKIPLRGEENLLKDLKDTFLNERFCDIQIHIGDRKIYVHKVILAARSSVFAAMFDHEMTEKKSGVIEINDCDPETFQDFLLALYTGKFDQVTPGKALELFKIANKYDYKDLKEECCRGLSGELDADMIVDVVQLATLYNEPELLENATELFIKNGEKVLSTEKWKTFMVEEPTSASELIIKMAKRAK